MSSAQTQIAVTSNVHNLATSQIQKDYSEDSLNRQNSFGNSRSRGIMKGKHLTRSHAMRESTSPPRTPTPRTDHQVTSTNCGLASSSSSSSSSSTSSTHSPSQETNDCKMHVQSSSSLLSPTPLLETPSVIVTSQHSQQTQQQQQQSVICNEADFPKLSPPKSSKSPRNSQSSNTNPNSGNSNNNNNNNNNSNNHNNNNNNTNRDLMDKFNNAHQQQCSAAAAAAPAGGSGEHTNKIEFGNGNGKKVVLEITKTIDTGGGGGNSGGGGNCIASNSCNMEYMNNQTENNSGSGSHYMHSDSRGMAQDGPISFYDKENRCPRNDSQNSNNSLSPDENQNSLTDSPSDISKHERMGKKHRTNSNSKSSKPRLKNMGSSSSMDGGNSNSTSGFISRDSSMEQFTDQSGVDLVLFFKETLNKNPKDRNTLMKIEKDLIELAQDKTRHEMRFPAASSYNRMLIHRTAAFFGMEHNVDTATQQCVIVATTKGTRLPDIRFKSLFRERMSDEPRKSILKRDTHSFDDARQSYLCPDRGTLDRKAKSFEEREEEYEKVRRRIFRNRENGEMMEEPYWNWQENSEQASRMRQSNKMLKVQSPQSNDMRNDGRPSVSKSHSFGGYGGPPPNSSGSGGGPLLRGDSMNSTKSAGPRMFSKQDSIGSTSTPWRLSPSSSGYKTQTQSLRSDSVTPSPTGYGSDEHTPEPSVVHSPPPAPCGLVWAVTDIASVPRGSVLINPHTLQPIVNQDGSIYHFDPSNLPPSQAMASGVYSKSPLGVNMKKKQSDKHKLGNKMDNSGGSDVMSSSSGSGGPVGEVVNNIITESSTETVSESSTQTVVLAAINRDEEIDSKDSITKREMDDIQEETTGISGEDCEKPIVTVTAKVFDRIEVQKFKHQATSPNIPSPDPEGQIQSNEIVPQNEPKIEIRAQPIQQAAVAAAELSNSSSSTPASINDSKKDEPKNWSYTQSYQALDGSTVFQTANTNPYSTTTYQQGPDGSVYAVPQGMVYTYPPPMDNEMQGYFMPVFDPSQQRDPNSLLPPGSQTIYQPTGGAAMLPVAAYPTTQFTGAPIYPGQVVYSSDQFAASGAAVAAAATGQMQQYPMTTTYPIGYPYPYNGYWGQTMTYYVPQQSLANAVPSSIIPQPTAPLQIPNGVSTSLATTVSQVNANNHSSAPNNNNSHTVSGGGGGGRGKRATPPHHQQNSVQGNSHSVSSGNTTYQLGPGVPLALASELNGPTMYAIPQHAVFSSNMLPYTHQSTTTPANAAAATGVLTPLPHQPNAVISSLFNHPPLTSSNGPVPVEPPQPTGYTVHANVSSNHAAANTGNAQSAPSTPHSLSHHNQRNPPLFATPPILSSNYNSPIQNHYQSFTDAQHTGGGSSHSYEKRNSNGVGGMNKNKSSNGASGGYSSNGRQNSSSSLYGTPNSNINNKPPVASNDISNQSSLMSSNGPQGQRPMHMGQSKRINGSDKSQNSLLNSPHMGINGGRSDSNHNSGNNNQNTQNGSDSKPRVSSGYRQKPSNLEFRRSVSQRNSPSANSNESNNNSPNSIVSSYTGGGAGIPSYVATAPDNQQSSPVYITRGTHIPPMHAAAQNAQAAAVVAAAAAANEASAGCHQPLIGAYNHPGAPAGVYIKYGQTYFAHPTVALQNNRRSPPSDLRPQMAPITGMYPAMNMMISAPRQVQPRHPNPNYKGSRPSR